MTEGATQKTYRALMAQVTLYNKTFDKWRTRAIEVMKRYRDERVSVSTNETARFNILWSNTQTLKGAIYARVPKPDVSRKFKDKDNIGRVASEILERALEFETTHYDDFHDSMRACVEDRLLPGRGTTWVRYEPHFETVGVGEDGFEVTEDADRDETYERLDSECTPVDYVAWNDFGHTVARTWDEVTGVWRHVYLTREKIAERFGDEIAAKVAYDSTPLSDDNDQKLEGNLEASDERQADIIEYWDLDSKAVYWFCKSVKDFLDVKSDFLKLEGFFPCPKPLFSTITTDSLIPLPDYCMYQDQAKELDILSDRINGLIKALKLVGIYDASQPALQRLYQEAFPNDLIPAKNWAQFAEKGGIKGSVDFVDLTGIVNALQAAYESRDQLKETIDEISGVGGILRGETDPNEAYKTNKMRAQFGTLRLRGMQNDVAEFATNVLRLKAQIICEHYRPETILKISGADQLQEEPQVIEQAIRLLKTGVLKAFRIEVDADTMVEIDEEADKQSRVEFLEAAGGFLEKAATVGAQAPELVPLLGGMLEFGIRGFKAGRQMEGQFDQAMQNLAQAAQQRLSNPQPNPEMMKLQGQQQIEKVKAQAKVQIEQAHVQAQTQTEAGKAQMEAQKQELDRQHEAQLQAMEFEHKQALKQMELSANAQLQIMLQKMRGEAQIEASEAKSGNTLTPEQEQAGQEGAS